jgi:multiple sugar transport system ATP-binding protein
MSSVSFEQVEKSYGEIQAVKEFDIDIEEGEFVSLLGPSGSGKSTLLRMVAGLEDISEGQIRIGDRVINRVPPRDRGIAMVFQNYALYPHMTVRDNMSYGLKLTTDLPKSDIESRVEETAEMLGIGDLLEKKPSSISGGQQQRVATGRAIVRDPEVFLMDEPLSNLDAKLRLHMRTELQRLHEELGTTTIYVTHDQEEAMTMSDRIVILAEGVIQQTGTADDIYQNPANLFVADFIGSPSMNFFDGSLEDERLVGADFSFPVSSEFASAIAAKGASELVMGIRPEDVSITDEQTDGVISTTVDVVEPIGSDNYLYVSIGDDDCTVRTPAHVRPEEGESVGVKFDEDAIHLFDTGTEENIFYE